MNLAAMFGANTPSVTRDDPGCGPEVEIVDAWLPPDAEAARVYMEAKRWPSGAACPACDEARRITTRKGGYYRCNACKSDFTVRTATIFERSHIPLHRWLYAMYLLVTSRKGISSMQLAKQIGVTQKSAWFMLQRLREACGNDPT